MGHKQFPLTKALENPRVLTEEPRFRAFDQRRKPRSLFSTIDACRFFIRQGLSGQKNSSKPNKWTLFLPSTGGFTRSAAAIVTSRPDPRAAGCCGGGGHRALHRGSHRHVACGTDQGVTDATTMPPRAVRLRRRCGYIVFGTPAGGRIKSSVTIFALIWDCFGLYQLRIFSRPSNGCGVVLF